MNFIEAMSALEQGKKIRRKDWDEGTWISRHGCSEGCDKMCSLRYRNDCIYSSDWELYEEPIKTYTFTFAEVLKGMEEGKRFIREAWSKECFHPGDCAGYKNAPTVEQKEFERKNHCINMEDLEAADWIEVKQ